MPDPAFMEAPQECAIPIELIQKAVQKAVCEAIEPLTKLIKGQQQTYEKQAKIVNALESKIKSQANTIKTQQQSIQKLQDEVKINTRKIDELEQYGRRNAVRISNVPVEDIPVIPDTNGRRDTDSFIISLCRDSLHLELSPSTISRSHIVGKVSHLGRCQIIVKFTRYNTRRLVYVSRTALKDDERDIFITEDLTAIRYRALKHLRKKRKHNLIVSAWSSDGRIFAKLRPDGKPILFNDYDLTAIDDVIRDSWIKTTGSLPTAGDTENAADTEDTEDMEFT